MGCKIRKSFQLRVPPFLTAANRNVQALSALFLDDPEGELQNSGSGPLVGQKIDSRANQLIEVSFSQFDASGLPIFANRI